MPDWWSLVGGYLFVFAARLADVSLSTVRFMMMVRGKKLLASVIGLVEILIWVTALGTVLKSLDNPISILFYSLGFATGIYVGQWLEEKLAIGIAAVQIIPNNNDMADDIWDALRKAGFGVTVLAGEGREGPRKVLMVTSHRKGLGQVLSIARRFDPAAFVTVLDAKAAIGGTGTMRHRK